MVEKILLTLSLLGVVGSNPKNEIKPFLNDEPNSKSTSRFTQCAYEKSDVTEDLIEMHSFKFGYIGREDSQNVDFTFSLLSPSFNYHCKFVYTTIDGSYSGYDEIFYEGNYGLQNGTLEIKRSELPLGTVNFSFYLAAYTNYEDIFNDYLRPACRFKMNFSLCNYGGSVLSIPGLRTECPYFFEYNEYKNEYCIYYDELIFHSGYYKVLYNQEIYFRIKPKYFVFYSQHVFNSTEGKLYILNNNGSFNDCTEEDAHGRYFPMVLNHLGGNTYCFSYKNVERGGKNNLYLDPLTMHMYKEKRNKLYEVENIYLPIRRNEIYSEKLSVMPVLTNFGSNYVNAGMAFSIFFGINSARDFYYSIERVNETGNDSSGEEIIP